MSALPCPELRDDAVSLRAWRQEDVPDLVAAFADPTIIRTAIRLPQPFTERDAEEWLAQQETRRFTGERITFAITESDVDRALGSVILSRFDWQHGQGMVGYWMHPDARGRGLARGAVLLVARWAFDTLDLARLELTTAPDNVDSQRLAERCGFVQEGTLRSHLQLPGRRRDSLLYSLLPADLASQA